MTQQAKMKKLLWCAAILYAAVMLWLLFGRGQFDIGKTYWEQVKMRINLVPANTIWQYLYLLIKQTNPYLVPYAFINLFGNIAAFVPFGFLLPCLCKKAKTFGKFLLYMVCLVAAIEIIQLFTLRGICDIDDFLLNVLGAIIGFALLQFIQKKMHLRPDVPNK